MPGVRTARLFMKGCDWVDYRHILCGTTTFRHGNKVEPPDRFDQIWRDMWLFDGWNAGFCRYNPDHGMHWHHGDTVLCLCIVLACALTLTPPVPDRHCSVPIVASQQLHARVHRWGAFRMMKSVLCEVSHRWGGGRTIAAWSLTQWYTYWAVCDWNIRFTTASSLNDAEAQTMQYVPVHAVG